MKRIALLVFGIFIFATGSAMAGIIQIGNPFPSGSWGQRFQVANIGQFDKMYFRIVTGATFDDPALIDLVDINNKPLPSWQQTSEGPSKAFSFGPGLTFLAFKIIFTSPDVLTSPAPFSFDFIATYNNDLDLKEHTVVTYDLDLNGVWSWSFTPQADSPVNPDITVPEPSLAILLGIGLSIVSLAAWRWKD